MIERLKIERFKSIRSLDMECRRINLFIGEPNVGKSNILEALGLLSWCSNQKMSLKDFVRFQDIANIFYDGLLDESIRIEFQGEIHGLEPPTLSLNLEGNSQIKGQSSVVTVKAEKDHFVIGTSDPHLPQIAKLNEIGEVHKDPETPYFVPVKIIMFYRFKSNTSYYTPYPFELIPPNGINFFEVIFRSSELRQRIVKLFEPFGLLVVMRQKQGDIVFQKQKDGLITEFPYEVMSDTLQRVMFYEAAMVSNKDAVLVFEEPEAHAFPFYTKHLGEQLALDETNQYFIATHNPYLLSAVVEKAKKDEVGVFITYWQDHETKVKMLTGDELSQLMDEDPFLGIESLLSGEGE